MAPAPTWKSDHRGRMEAVRSLLRPSNPPARSGSARGAVAREEAPEWASPAFARVRARPSSIYAPLRSSPTFPLSHRRGNPNVATRSPRSDLPTSFHARERGATEVAADAESGGEWSAAIRLGAFGDVANMTLETVNFLIRVLEDRRHELLENDENEERERSMSSQALDQSSHRWDGDASATSDLHESTQDTPGVYAPVSPGRQLNRTHSYEALVRLEGILESRHQQLMQDGIGADEDEDSHERDVLQITDIQDEVKRIYGSLRAEELAENESTRGN